MYLHQLWPPGRRMRRLRRLAVALLLTSALVVTAACSAGNGQAGGGSDQAGGSGGSGGQSKKMGKPYQYGIAAAWGTSWVYNKYTSYYPGFADGLVYQPLGVHQPPKLTDYKPALADKWTTKDHKITVHIQDGQKWENGKPVTSADLITTMMLDATQGSALMNDISGVKADGKSKITVTVRKNIPTDLALVDLLDLRPLPKSQWGKFVSSDLKKDIFTYYDQYVDHPDKADNSTAKKHMDKAFKKLSKFKPKKMIGNGPFKLESMNTQKAKLKKSKTYADADKIRIPELDYVNGQEAQVLYSKLTAKRLDFSNVYLPGPIAKKLSHAQSYHVALPLAFEFAMYFNSRNGPTSDKGVRQALAYVMNRDKMAKAAYGTVNPGGKAEKHPDGLLPSQDKQYLSKGQISQLNQYKPDKKKATQLLENAGYKKSGKHWLTPSGSKFTLTMLTNKGTPDITTSFKSAAADLTDFGIKTEVRAVPGAKVDHDLHKGDFDISYGFPNNPNPLKAFNDIIGRENNFSVSGTNKGEPGLGYGPKVDIPGQGTINVPQTLGKQSRHVGPGKKMNKLTWSWAQAINEDLPYLQYANKVYQFSYMETNYTKYPPDDSPLWDMISYDMNDGFVQAMTHGYIRPR